MLIGKRIRALRKTKGMPLTELARLSGVQLATLSRIENEKMVGTVESHTNIAKALGIDLPQLYKDIIREDTPAEIKTPKSTLDVFAHNDQAYYEILTNNVLAKKMMPVLLKIEPKGKTNPEQNQPGTEKFVFVLEGQIEVRIGKTGHSLKRNNTLYFDASLEHYFVNAGAAMAKVICIVTPVAL